MSMLGAVRVGDPLAVEHYLWYYDRYISKLCTRTFSISLYKKGLYTNAQSQKLSYGRKNLLKLTIDLILNL